MRQMSSAATPIWYTGYMSSAEAILGLKTGAEGLVDAVRLGLPIKSFTLVAEYTALSRQQLAAAAGIPLRTVQRRPARLRPDESDRLARVARIYALAEAVLGSRAMAERWMVTPNWSLDDMRPLDLLDTEVSAREVEDALGRIDDGAFA